jgi:hypothetical protein
MAEKKSWIDTLSETVDKATKAAAEAWDGTADARKEAWEKTKSAVNSASDAIDAGVEKAKEAYREGASDDAIDAEPVDESVGVVDAVDEQPSPDHVDRPDIEVDTVFELDPEDSDSIQDLREDLESTD